MRRLLVFFRPKCVCHRVSERNGKNTLPESYRVQLHQQSKPTVEEITAARQLLGDKCMEPKNVSAVLGK
jgi:hypothetical protein